MPRTAVLLLLLTSWIQGQDHGGTGAPARSPAAATTSESAGTQPKQAAKTVVALVHHAQPSLPPEAALEHVREGNQRYVEARKRGASPAEPMARPAGAGRFVVAVIGCADAAVDVPALLGLRPQDLLWISNAGACADAEAADLALYAAQEHRVSLCIVLTHTGCPSLGENSSQKPDTATVPRAEHRSAKARELARRRDLRLAHAQALLQCEQLDAAIRGPVATTGQQATRAPLRTVPATVDVRTGAIEWHVSRAEQMPIAPVR
jgi:carbonic anhydrase